MDGLCPVPVGRDLEDGGAAETTMGEKHFLAEGIFPGRGDDFGGDTRERGIALLISAMEEERDEGWASGNDVVAELAGEVIAERGGAHLRDGEAAGGDDKCRSTEFVGAGAKNEFGGAGGFGDASVEENLNARGAALGFKQVGDV